MKIPSLSIAHAYQVVYADPPWQYNDKSLHRGGAERHYGTMSEVEIAGLPIRGIVAPDAILFMWATWPHIASAINLITIWGFTYKTCAFVWIKTNKKTPSKFWGMGHWTRSNTEFVLLGVRGRPIRGAKNVHQVVETPIESHSRKPDVVRSRIELLTEPWGQRRIELFARESVPGWDAWGNEL